MSNISRKAQIELSNSLDKNKEFTMSSLEIAELTGKRHKNVLADIRIMFQQVGVDGLRFEATYKAGNGERRACYNLPRYESDLLLTGYSVPYRAAVIKRWYELEAKEAKPEPTIAEMTRIVMKSLDEQIALDELEAVVAEQPKQPQAFTLIEALQQALNSAVEEERVTLLLEEAKPALEYHDKVMKSLDEQIALDDLVVIAMEGLKKRIESERSERLYKGLAGIS